MDVYCTVAFNLLASVDRNQGDIWNIDGPARLAELLRRVGCKICSNSNLIHEAGRDHLLQSSDLFGGWRIQLILVFQVGESRNICPQQLCDLSSQLLDFLKHLVSDKMALTPFLCRFMSKLTHDLQKFDSIGFIV